MNKHEEIFWNKMLLVMAILNFAMGILSFVTGGYFGIFNMLVGMICIIMWATTSRERVKRKVKFKTKYGKVEFYVR